MIFQQKAFVLQKFRIVSSAAAVLRAVLLFFLFLLSESVFSYSLYLRGSIQSKTESIPIAELGRFEGLNAGKFHFSMSGEKPVFLDRDAVQKLLLREVGNSPERIYGKGIWILPLGEELSGSALHNFLLSEIKKIPGTNKEKNSVALHLEEGQKLKTCKNCSLELQLPGNVSRMFSGKRIISADIVVLDSGRKKILLRQKIALSVLKKVLLPVAARDIYRGKRLESADFQMVEKEIDPDDTNFIESDVLGRRAVNDVKKGDVLSPSSVQMLADVRRGQSLEVVYQTETIVLKCRSIAGSDGNIGDTIPVTLLLPSGKKSDTKRVRVVSADTAVFGAY